MPTSTWSRHKVKDPQYARRTRSFGGCSTCRARRMKCDESRPTCNTCRAAQLVCSGYEKTIFFGGASDTDAGTTSGGSGRFRRHLLTESERWIMSDAIRSDVPPSQALGNIADIDDWCDTASSCEDIQITRGPFGAFRLSGAASSDALLELSNAPDPALSSVGSSETMACAPLAISDDIQEVIEDVLLPLTPQTTLPRSDSPFSISAILNEFDSPSVDYSGLPWMPLSDAMQFGGTAYVTDGRAQEVSDDLPWAADLPPSPGLAHDLDAAGLGISPLSGERPLTMCSNSIPQSIEQDVPHGAVFLLKHYSSTVLTSLTPFQHSKTPWHVLFIPHVKSSLAALTLGERLDRASLCTFYATLALSASSIARISTSPKWYEQTRAYKQQAHWHAFAVLQSAYTVPKPAKYKAVLMALLSMVQTSTIIGERDHAEYYLLETEKLIRIKGLNRRKSRKVRLLHHCYVFERLIHESLWPPSVDTSDDHRRRVRFDIESCGAGAFSRDSLGFDLAQWNDLDKDMLRKKDQVEGENDLHLQIPGSWPATLYPEIFGVPEIQIFLLSMTIRLAKAKDDLGGPGGVTIGEFMKRAKSIERMMYQRHPFRFSAVPSSADEENNQSQKLLNLLTEAMQEALAIYFYRSVYDLEGRMLQTNVTKVVECLSQIDGMDSGFGALRLFWPALVAAKEAVDPESRAFLAEWFAKCARRNGASIFSDTLGRVQMIWKGR